MRYQTRKTDLNLRRWKAKCSFAKHTSARSRRLRGSYRCRGRSWEHPDIIVGIGAFASAPCRLCGSQLSECEGQAGLQSIPR
jgi:hypothetical protein